MHVCHVSACVHVCESLWYCSPCYCGLDGHSPFFKCQATRWATQCTWVCLTGCLGNDLTSPSLLIGPGVQVLPLRVMDTDQGNDLGIQAWEAMEYSLRNTKRYELQRRREEHAQQ